PDDLRKEHLGLLVHWSKTREFAGIQWSLAKQPDDESASVIVTTDGMMLRNNSGWSDLTNDPESSVIEFPDAHAVPQTTIRWRGTECRLSVAGVVISPYGIADQPHQLVRI